jgi:hypothetical protein
MIYAIVVALTGVFIMADGVASVFLPQNHHSLFFDSERYIRAIAGALLIAMAVYAVR